MEVKLKGMTMLTPLMLAKRWQVSVGTLCNWRGANKGPAYMKFGKGILYKVEDIERYEREHTVEPEQNGTQAREGTI